MAAIRWEELFELAEQARRRAYAPYSRFQVGAAVQCDDGSLVAGCNVENASYGLTCCAERNAVGQLVLSARAPVAVAIVTAAKDPTPPCGMCRQVLAEFAAPATPVRSRTLKGREARYTVRQLLPAAFTGRWLGRR